MDIVEGKKFFDENEKIEREPFRCCVVVRENEK
jgi:hypothetical protein